MKKTSISLPRRLVGRWRNAAPGFADFMAFRLPALDNGIPSRERLTRYNQDKSRFTIISVYWPMPLHNQLRAVAGALRISVSLLVTRILDSEDNPPREMVFLNYGFSVNEWSPRRMEITESITYLKASARDAPPLSP